MELHIGYDEISTYVSKNYDKNISIEYIDQRTATVKASIKVLFMSLTMPVTLHIDNVNSESITLTYSGKFGIDMIVSGALNFLTSNVDDIKKIVSIENQTITVHLKEIKSLKPTLEKIKLEHINFAQEGINAIASIK